MLVAQIPNFAFLGLVLYALHTFSQNPDAEAAERTVFETGFFTILGGAAINFICAGVTWGVGAVPPGEEFGACSPYGLAGGAVAARLHLYKINGYGPREWYYVKSLPNIMINKLGGQMDRALDRLDDELLKRGILKERPGAKRRAREAEQKMKEAEARLRNEKKEL